MPRNKRDATPTWSGFSYQGLLGLYVAVDFIQNEYDHTNGYFLEYENQEDFVISNGEVVKSVHQVKAYTNSPNLSDYSEVWRGKYNSKKNTRVDFEGTKTGKNYLHTLVEIDHWEDQTTWLGFLIERYSLHNNCFCFPNGIYTGFLEEKIGLYYQQQGVSDSRKTSTTKYLIRKLEDEIINAHIEGRSPKLELSDIKDWLDGETDLPETIIPQLKEKLYNCFAKYLIEINATNQFTDDQASIFTDKIKRIYCLSDNDFLNMLANFFPHRTDFPRQIRCEIDSHDYFEETPFRNIIFSTLIKAVPDYNLRKAPQYNINYYHANGSGYTLTAIDEAMRFHTEDSICATKILQNKYFDQSLYENQNIINGHFEGSLFELANKVTNISHKEDFKKFAKPKNIRFMPYERAIEEINS